MKISLGSSPAGVTEYCHLDRETPHLAIFGRADQGIAGYTTRIVQALTTAKIDVDVIGRGYLPDREDGARRINQPEWQDYLGGLELLHADRLSAAMAGSVTSWKPVVVVIDGFSTFLDQLTDQVGCSPLALPHLISHCTGLGIHFVLLDNAMSTHWYTAEITSTAMTKISAPLATATSFLFWGADTSTPPSLTSYFLGQSHRHPRAFEPACRPIISFDETLRAA